MGLDLPLGVHGWLLLAPPPRPCPMPPRNFFYITREIEIERAKVTRRFNYRRTCSLFHFFAETRQSETIGSSALSAVVSQYCFLQSRVETWRTNSWCNWSSYGESPLIHPSF